MSMASTRARREATSALGSAFSATTAGLRQGLGKHDGIVAGCGTRHAAMENVAAWDDDFLASLIAA